MDKICERELARWDQVKAKALKRAIVESIEILTVERCEIDGQIANQRRKLKEIEDAEV